MKPRITFIINPVSGTAKKDKVVRLIPRIIDGTRFQTEIIYTRYAGHACEIAAGCAQNGGYAVVAVGGDGTVNEVARALVGTDTALGIIPTGSGNGLARHLHIPLKPTKALQTVNDGCLLVMDGGRINGTPFFCTCGMGFDARISYEFARAGTRGLGTYVKLALRDIFRYKGEAYDFEIEDAQGDIQTFRHKAFIITCGNASQYGNNVYVAPEASVTDSLLDVTVVEPFKFYQAPGLFLRMLNRTLQRGVGVHTYKCRRVKIHRAAEGVMHYDGDPVIAPAELDIRIVPSALKVMVPAACKSAACATEKNIKRYGF